MKIIAVAFSDLHQNDWRQHSVNHSRLNITEKALCKIADACIEHQVPCLFTGDWVHEAKSLENRVVNKLYTTYNRYFQVREIPVFAISGNHDQCEKNFKGNESPNYLQGLNEIFSTFHLVDFKGFETKDFNIYGIPYITGNRDYKKAIPKILNNSKRNILLIHTDLPGAKESDGREVGTVENIPNKVDKLFKEFDLILSGHIHMKQKLGRNTYMLGATNHQKISDEGTEMGYWVIYDNLKPQFINLRLPEFKTLNEGDEIPEDDNFYTILPKEQLDLNIPDEKVFNQNLGRDQLAKKYLKIKGIRDKKKKKILLDLLNE